MIVDYESTQSVELSTPNGYREAGIVIGLHQTHKGYPPSFNPIDGGDPGSEPEWEITTVSVIDGDGKSREFGTLATMEDILETFVGAEMWEEITHMATLDALENYEDDGGYDG